MKADKAEIHKLDTLIKEMSIEKNETILMKLDIEGMKIESIKGATGFIRYYSKITFIIENKHSSKNHMKDVLSEIKVFEFGVVDEFNMNAKE